MALAVQIGHSQGIETTAPPFTVRYASTIAAVLLVLSATAAAAMLWVYREDAEVARLVNAPLTTVFELLCYGLVGSLLISRRPDLPFGWILGLGAVSEIALVGIGLPSLALADGGNQSQFLAWGICLGVVQWVPTALQGVINVRFPSGRPSSAVGHWLDRALCYGIALALVGSYLGDSVLANLAEPVSNHRFVDGTWVTPIGNASIVLIPFLILLGILAGIGVIVRCFRARGIEREQLQWRAAGAAASLLLFPLTLLGVLDGLEAVAPIVFASTLAIPVLRYQLWSGDRFRVAVESALWCRGARWSRPGRKSAGASGATFTTDSAPCSPACASTSTPPRRSSRAIRRKPWSTWPQHARPRPRPSPTCAVSSTE